MNGNEEDKINKGKLETRKTKMTQGRHPSNRYWHAKVPQNSLFLSLVGLMDESTASKSPF